MGRDISPIINQGVKSFWLSALPLQSSLLKVGTDGRVNAVSGGVEIAGALGFTPANDSAVVHKTGDETIAGVKTFSNDIVMTGSRNIFATGSSFALGAVSGGGINFRLGGFDVVTDTSFGAYGEIRANQVRANTFTGIAGLTDTCSLVFNNSNGVSLKYAGLDKIGVTQSTVWVANSATIHWGLNDNINSGIGDLAIKRVTANTLGVFRGDGTTPGALQSGTASFVADATYPNSNVKIKTLATADTTIGTGIEFGSPYSAVTKAGIGFANDGAFKVNGVVMDPTAISAGSFRATEYGYNFSPAIVLKSVSGNEHGIYNDANYMYLTTNRLSQLRVGADGVKFNSKVQFVAATGGVGYATLNSGIDLNDALPGQTGIQYWANNLTFWMNNIPRFNLSSLKDFRIPSDHMFAWSGDAGNNSAGDTFIKRVSAGVVGIYQADGTTAGDLVLNSLKAPSFFNAYAGANRVFAMGGGYNYYDNNYHLFRSIDGGSNYGLWSATSLEVYTPLIAKRLANSSFGTYSQFKNSNGFVDAEITEGLAAGYGGSYWMRDGLGGSGYAKFEYNSGYPQFITNASSFQFTITGASVTMTNAYNRSVVGGNAGWYHDSERLGVFEQTPAGRFQVTNTITTIPSCVVKAAPSQTANGFEYRKSDNTVLMKVDANGAITATGDSVFNTGVGEVKLYNSGPSYGPAIRATETTTAKWIELAAYNWGSCSINSNAGINMSLAGSLMVYCNGSGNALRFDQSGDDWQLTDNNRGNGFFGTLTGFTLQGLGSRTFHVGTTFLSAGPSSSGAGSHSIKYNMPASGQLDIQTGNGSGTWQSGYRQEYNAGGFRCSFYGATPIARPSGDIGTSLVSLGLMSQVVSPLQIKIPDVGTLGAKKLYIEVPYSFNVTSWKLLPDASGSMVVDILKSTYATYPTLTSITGTAKPTLTAAAKGTSSTLTGWTTSLVQGDILEVNVESSSGISSATLILYGTR